MEGQRASFHPLVYALNGCSSQDYARWKPGAQSLFWVSHVGAGDQAFGPSSTALPSIITKEPNQKWSSWVSNWHPYGMLT